MGWRRRYCPSPVFIALFVALCVFYQCLSLFWKSIPWTKEWDIRRSLDLLEVATQNKECLYTWNNLVTKIKDYEDRLKKKPFSNTKKMLLLYLYHSTGIEESLLYKRVLTKLGYTIHHFAEINSIKVFITHNQKTLGRDALMYIPLNESMEISCKQKQELVELVQLTKVKVLTQMQQIPCIKDEICQLAAYFPELQNLSVCTYHPEESRNEKLTSVLSDNAKKKHQYLTTRGINQLSKSPYQNVRVYHHDHPFQDFPVIRTFVVITSLSPLRAFIHSTAMVQTEPKKLFTPIQLQKFYQDFFKSESPLQAFNTLKEIISKLLLTMEVASEAVATGRNSLNRCRESFQLVTFDIGYNSASHPIVHQVKEQLMLNDLNVDGYTTMETILEDVFNVILHNHSYGILEAMEEVQNCLSLKNTCWMDSILAFTWEQMDNLCFLQQEQTKLGMFVMLYPSNSVLLKALRRDLYHKADLRDNLGSTLAVHDLLSDLYECLQSLQEINQTSRQKFQDKKENKLSVISRQNKRVSVTKKWMKCSDDNDTLSYINRIFSNPPLDLTPEFNPKIKDYYAELPFDVVTVEIGAEPANCKSQVHLDNKNGPRIAV